MEENNFEKQLNQTGEIATDVLLRITALERLLISRGIVQKDELVAALTETSNELMEQVKAALSKDEE